MSALLDAVAGLATPWAYVVIGLLATAESAAFIGLVIPGEAALLLGGFLAYQGRASVLVMAGVAAAGAIVGDSIGYEIGRRTGEPLRRSRLGQKVGDQRWDRGQAFLANKGGRAVFLGRWVGLLRALVPTLAGMGRLPYRTFVPFNVLGGLTWAPTFVLLGYVAGGSYKQVERAAGQASLFLVIVGVLIVAVVLGARWVARHPDRVRTRFTSLRALRWVTRHRRVMDFLGARVSPGGASGLWLTAGLLGLLGIGWVFGELLDQVRDGQGLTGIDRPALVWLIGERTAWLTDVMRTITTVGSPRGLALTALLVAGALATREKSWRPVLLAAPVVLGIELLGSLVKLAVARPRPPISFAVPDVSAHGFAFPSGHAGQSAAIYGVVAFLLAARVSGWPGKVAVWTGAVLAAGAVGVSRLYLGVHWLTDVLAGWALGVAWLGVVLLAVTLLRQRAAETLTSEAAASLARPLP